MYTKKGGKCKRKAKLITEGTCVFCQRAVDDETLYGKLYAIGDIRCHYFCALLSCCLVQKGKDTEGLFGFLYPDIVAEVERSKKHRCSYCNRDGASLGCSVASCRKQFHLPCGRERDAVSLFYGNYKSFCALHAPTQKVSDDIKAKVQSRKAEGKRQKRSQKLNAVQESKESERVEEAICVICYEPVQGYPCARTFWPSCCARDAWLHRQCLQRMALSAGVHYLKCPLCNDKENFLQAVLGQGYFVPDRDAAWELEQNAFAEIYERHLACGAELCLCPSGRDHDADTGSWELKLCILCGSAAVHSGCEANGHAVLVCGVCAPAAPADLDALVADLQTVQLQEPHTEEARRGPPMPSRMSLRRTKPRHQLTSGPSCSRSIRNQVGTENPESKTTQSCRTELNLKTPKRRIMEYPIRHADSPLLSPSKLAVRLRGADSVVPEEQLLDTLRARMGKPGPLSAKRRTLENILEELFGASLQDVKVKDPLKEWVSPKKMCDIPADNQTNSENQELPAKETDGEKQSTDGNLKNSPLENKTKQYDDKSNTDTETMSITDDKLKNSSSENKTSQFTDKNNSEIGKTNLIVDDKLINSSSKTTSENNDDSSSETEKARQTIHEKLCNRPSKNTTSQYGEETDSAIVKTERIDEELKCTFNQTHVEPIIDGAKLRTATKMTLNAYKSKQNKLKRKLSVEDELEQKKRKTNCDVKMEKDLETVNTDTAFDNGLDEVNCAIIKEYIHQDNNITKNREISLSLKRKRYLETGDNIVGFEGTINNTGLKENVVRNEDDHTIEEQENQKNGAENDHLAIDLKADNSEVKMEKDLETVNTDSTFDNILDEANCAITEEYIHQDDNIIKNHEISLSLERKRDLESEDNIVGFETIINNTGLEENVVRNEDDDNIEEQEQQKNGAENDHLAIDLKADNSEVKMETDLKTVNSDPIFNNGLDERVLESEDNNIVGFETIINNTGLEENVVRNEDDDNIEEQEQQKNGAENDHLAIDLKADNSEVKMETDLKTVNSDPIFNNGLDERVLESEDNNIVGFETIINNTGLEENVVRNEDDDNIEEQEQQKNGAENDHLAIDLKADNSEVKMETDLKTVNSDPIFNNGLDERVLESEDDNNIVGFETIINNTGLEENVVRNEDDDNIEEQEQQKNGAENDHLAIDLKSDNSEVKMETDLETVNSDPIFNNGLDEVNCAIIEEHIHQDNNLTENHTISFSLKRKGDLEMEDNIVGFQAIINNTGLKENVVRNEDDDNIEEPEKQKNGEENEHLAIDLKADNRSAGIDEEMKIIEVDVLADSVIDSVAINKSAVYDEEMKVIDVAEDSAIDLKANNKSAGFDEKVTHINVVEDKDSEVQTDKNRLVRKTKLKKKSTRFFLTCNENGEKDVSIEKEFDIKPNLEVSKKNLMARKRGRVKDNEIGNKKQSKTKGSKSRDVVDVTVRDTDDIDAEKKITEVDVIADSALDSIEKEFDLKPNLEVSKKKLKARKRGRVKDNEIGNKKQSKTKGSKSRDVVDVTVRDTDDIDAEKRITEVDVIADSALDSIEKEFDLKPNLEVSKKKLKARKRGRVKDNEIGNKKQSKTKGSKSRDVVDVTVRDTDDIDAEKKITEVDVIADSALDSEAINKSAVYDEEMKVIDVAADSVIDFKANIKSAGFDGKITLIDGVEDNDSDVQTDKKNLLVRKPKLRKKSTRNFLTCNENGEKDVSNEIEFDLKHNLDVSKKKLKGKSARRREKDNKIGSKKQSKTRGSKSGDVVDVRDTEIINLKYKKRHKRKLSIRNNDIKVKIRWKREHFKLMITEKRKKKKDLNSDLTSPKVLKQCVLNYATKLTSHREVIIKPENEVTPVKKKYIKQEKNSDNMVQTNISNFFKSIPRTKE